MRLASTREELLASLSGHGVALIADIFTPAELDLYWQEARGLQFEAAPEALGVRQARQQLATTPIPIVSRLNRLVGEVESTLRALLGDEVFSKPLHFTERRVQRYAEGTLGIEQHRDSAQYRGLVVLIGLSGSGQFRVYESITGPEVARYDFGPNSMLLMRAPGFLEGKTAGSAAPVHSVDTIRAGPNGFRYVVGLRGE
jgi:hypothetical protein